MHQEAKQSDLSSHVNHQIVLPLSQVFSLSVIIRDPASPILLHWKFSEAFLLPVSIALSGPR